MTVALHLENVAHSYGDTDALLGVDLQVAAGELIALVGPSGSGKSTLLAIAGGLLRPTSGAARVAGEDLYALGERERIEHRREQVGYVFQASNLLGSLTAEENVMAPEVLRGRDKHQARTEARGLLAELGLQGKEHRRVHELSGGERQRVGIGRALIGRPAVLLADEPTANLDGERSRAVVDLLHAEVRARSVAAVLVTHDERVLDLVDRVVRITDGRIEPGAAQAAGGSVPIAGASSMSGSTSGA